jgi:dolichyl-phosphate-mannose--protein O-mannosyl transferase
LVVADVKTAMTESRAPRAVHIVYQSLLGVASGFSLGWFAWIIAGRQMSDPPLWPFAAVGIFLGVVIVRMAASTPKGRKWVHALWIPVVAFVVLMTAVVIALRNWGS